MCDLFGTSSAADKAEKDAKKLEKETKEAEAKRQAAIKLGNENIETAFSQYNDPYYAKYQETFRNNYNPKIDQQYGDAVDKLTAALAGRGVLDSSVGANKLAEAKRVNDEARIQVANDAASSAGDLKSKIAGRKTDLYTLNQAAADPEGIMAQATGAASALAAPQQYSPLGDLFANVLNSYANFNTAQNYSPGPSYTYKPVSSGKVIK